MEIGVGTVYKYKNGKTEKIIGTEKTLKAWIVRDVTDPPDKYSSHINKEFLKKRIEEGLVEIVK